MGDDAEKVFPSNIGMVVFDFDGVFTDNKVYVLETGQEIVMCDRRDGLGISMLKKIGIPMIILSTEKNQVVSKRAEKIGVEVHQGCGDKAKFLREFCSVRGINLKEMVYVGNDINDLSAMRMVGLSFAPSDAHTLVLQQASYVLQSKGGEGAVREFCELLYLSRVGNLVY